MILYMFHGKTRVNNEYENIIFIEESPIISEKNAKCLYFLLIMTPKGNQNMLSSPTG